MAASQITAQRRVTRNTERRNGQPDESQHKQRSQAAIAEQRRRHSQKKWSQQEVQEAVLERIAVPIALIDRQEQITRKLVDAAAINMRPDAPGGQLLKEPGAGCKCADYNKDH